MFALYMFGGAIERVFGNRRYLIYYLRSRSSRRRWRNSRSRAGRRRLIQP